MQIINRDANIKGVCYRISSSGRICDISKADILNISASFEELRKGGNDISNIADLAQISEMVRKQQLAKMRVLREEQSSGYVLIGSLTCFGIILVGTIIFMAIKFMLVR